jgi:hypothetical protein
VIGGVELAGGDEEPRSFGTDVVGVKMSIHFMITSSFRFTAI